MRVFKVAAKVPKIPKVLKTKFKQPVTFVDFVSVSEKVHSIKQSIFTYSHLFRSLYIIMVYLVSVSGYLYVIIYTLKFSFY